MTEIMSEALARIDGYVDPRADRARVSALRRDLDRSALGPRLATAQATYNHLLETSSDIAAIREAWEALQNAQHGAAFYNALHSDLQSLANNRRELTSYSAADARPALEWLNGQLGQLVADVRELDHTLGPVSSTELAIRGSEPVIIAWRDLAAACDRYEAVRQAQNAIMMPLNRGNERATTIVLPTLGRLRNAFDLESYWIEARRPTHSRENWPEAAPFFEWLDNPPAATWVRLKSEIWPTDDRHAYLRWMATKAAPWVPTVEQLNEADQAVTTMMSNPHTLDGLRAALDAYDAYFTRRGVTSVRRVDVNEIRAALRLPGGAAPKSLANKILGKPSIPAKMRPESPEAERERRLRLS